MSDRSMLSPDAEAVLLEVEQVIGEAMEAVLPAVVNRDVTVRVEGIGAADRGALRGTYSTPCVGITVECTEGAGWGGRFLFESQTVAKIADLMMMGDGTVAELEEEHLDAIKEAMDQVMGVVERSLSARFDGRVRFDPSAVQLSTLTDEEFSDPELMAVHLQMKIEDVIESPVTQLVSQRLIAERLGRSEEPSAAAGAPEPPKGQRLLDSEELEAAFKGVSGHAGGTPPPPAARSEPSRPTDQPHTAGASMEPGPTSQGTGGPSIQPVQFAQFDPPKSTPSEPRNLNLLLDLTLPISVELGRVMMTIQDILELGQGAIVELDKLAGEPVDLLVNDKKFAEGEVVVVDENFGVRITALVSPRDRLGSLQ